MGKRLVTAKCSNQSDFLRSLLIKLSNLLFLTSILLKTGSLYCRRERS